MTFSCDCGQEWTGVVYGPLCVLLPEVRRGVGDKRARGILYVARLDEGGWR